MSDGVGLVVINAISTTGHTIDLRVAKIIAINGVPFEQFTQNTSVDLESRLTDLENHVSLLTDAYNSVSARLNDLASHPDQEPHPEET